MLTASLAACGGAGGGNGREGSIGEGVTSSSTASVATSSNASASSGGSAVASVVCYDFSAGDTLSARNGWAFASTRWPLAAIPGGTGSGLPFTYSGVVPGDCAAAGLIPEEPLL